MRGIFFDEEVVRTVERRLLADGFEVAVSRERFAGEDDDEDHPWAVVTDAPVVVLELLVDQYDGWLDDGPSQGPPGPPGSPGPVAPAPLPGAPKRLHRPGDTA